MKNRHGTHEAAFRAVSIIFIITITLITSGCVSFTYQQDVLEKHLLSQQPAKALEALDNQKLSDRDKVLYYLNKGILLRMQEELQASNATLEQAKPIIEALDALSLREQATAISVNDAMRSYLPPLFERAMLHAIMALNYLELGENNSARVEALQLNELLKQNSDNNKLPFAHYIIGLVFEANGELDDAMIAYRQTYNDYRASNTKIPLLLQQDLLRLSEYLDIHDEQEKYQDEFQLKQWPTQAELKQKGQIVAVIFNGLIPRKHSQAISAASFNNGQLHRISVPFYETRIPQIRSVTLLAAGQRSQAELVDQLDQYAYTNLRDQMPAIIARTVARVSVKNKLVDNASGQSPLLGIALNIATFVSEQADTRAWNTLPQNILIARSTLLPDKYDVELKLDNQYSKLWPDIKITKDKIHFISWHWPNSNATGMRPR